MRSVQLRVTAHGHEDAIHPVYDIWANADYIERSRALQWNQSGEVLGIFHYARGDADAFEAAIREIPEVIDYEIARAGDDAFYVYLRDATTTSLQRMFGSLTEGALVIVPPIVYHEDGWVTVSTFGPDERIQDAIERIPDPVEVRIEKVSDLAATRPAVESGLTDRQRRAVEAALDLGYYEIPRTASHEDVAAELDCAPSTAAEHLRKAESAVLESVFRRS
jgi:predicted DNA binding protein